VGRFYYSLHVPGQTHSEKIPVFPLDSFDPISNVPSFDGRENFQYFFERFRAENRSAHAIGKEIARG